MILNARKLTLDIVLTFSRQFAAGFLKLGVILLIARTLGPEGAGSWSVAQFLPATLGQLLNLGLVSANVYFVASRRAEIQEVWEASRDLALMMALAGILVGMMVVGLAGDIVFPGVDSTLLFLALGIFPVTLFNGLVTGLFQAQRDFRHYNILALTEPVVTLALMGVLWTTTGLSLISAMLVTIIGYGATLVLGLLFLRRHLRLWTPTRDRLGYLRPALRYGIVAHLSNLVTFLNYRLDIYLVNLFLGPAATGIYTIAIRLVEQLWILSQAVSTVIFPLLSALHAEISSHDLLTVVIARATLWASTAAGLALLFLGGPLIGILFGHEFEQATGVLALLLPGVVLLACARVLANDLASRGKVAINFYISIGLLVINVVGTLLLIRPFGLAGAAIASSIAYALSLVAQLFVHSKMSSQKWWKTLLPQPEDLRWLKELLGKLHRL